MKVLKLISAQCVSHLRKGRALLSHSHDISVVINCCSLQGEGLTRGVTKDDYVVIIGRNKCNISVLANRYLRCLPKKPKTLGENEPKQAVEVSNFCISVCTLSHLMSLSTAF